MAFWHTVGSSLSSLEEKDASDAEDNAVDEAEGLGR
jgi:hypothetical protein